VVCGSKPEHADGVNQEVSVPSIGDSGRMSEAVSIKSWTWYSLVHLRAAALFTRHGAQVEHQYQPGDDPAKHAGSYQESRAYATGAVLEAVAFLESTVNELFASAVGGTTAGPLAAYDPAAVQRLGITWTSTQCGKKAFSFARILDKYAQAVADTGKGKLKLGQRPAQDVKLLILLRNWLVHYIPTWQEVGVKTGQGTAEDKLAQQLSRRFKPNAFMASSTGNPFLPDRCMGYGCARWAVLSSVKFVDAFFAQLGLASPVTLPLYDVMHFRFSPRRRNEVSDSAST
jgi:hypothetical protein